MLSRNTHASHDQILVGQQWSLLCLLFIACTLILALTLRAVFLSLEFKDATLLLIPSEAIPGHNFSVLIRLRPRRKLRLDEIKIGILCKERQRDTLKWSDDRNYSHSVSAVYNQTIFEKWISTGHNLVLEPGGDFDIEQPIHLPRDLQHERPTFDLDWSIQLHVKIPLAPDYCAEFPIQVLPL